MTDLLEQVAWAICKASSLPTLEPCEQLCSPCISASKAACALALKAAAQIAHDKAHGDTNDDTSFYDCKDIEAKILALARAVQEEKQ